MTHDPTPDSLLRLDHAAMIDCICDELYKQIATAVMAEALTPSIAQLAIFLPDHFPSISRDTVSRLVHRLHLQGRIVIDNPISARRYGLPGSPRRTALRRLDSTPRVSRQEVRPSPSVQTWDMAGWPRPTDHSIAAYDAAMAKRPYAGHNSVPRDYLDNHDCGYLRRR